MKGWTLLSFLICWVIIIIINLTIGYFCTDYVLEFYATKLAKESVEISAWVSLVLGLFLGEITIPLSILTWGVISKIW